MAISANILLARSTGSATEWPTWPEPTVGCDWSSWLSDVLVHPESSIDMNDEPAHGARKSGIRVMGEMSWGTHICVFYEAEQDLLATNASYFAAGLEDNEFCIWAISDPIDAETAKDELRQSIPDIDVRVQAGQMEIIPGSDWYLPGGEFDLQRITGGWSEKLRAALERGYAGIRISGNAFWIGTSHWQEFCQYEHELDHSLVGQKMLVLCTYSLSKSRAVDLLDVARAHQFTITRRNGEWEFLETPELQAAKQEIRKLNGALDILADVRHATFTARERIVLAHIVRGYSSKEIARALGIVPRTVEFHRANLLKKTNARSTVHLLHMVLGE